MSQEHIATCLTGNQPGADAGAWAGTRVPSLPRLASRSRDPTAQRTTKLPLMRLGAECTKSQFSLKLIIVELLDWSVGMKSPSKRHGDRFETKQERRVIGDR